MAVAGNRRRGRNRRAYREGASCVAVLANVQANILGVFLNKYAKHKSSEYYYYYYYNNKKRKRVKSRA